jgi:hypothetical protein
MSADVGKQTGQADANLKVNALFSFIFVTVASSPYGCRASMIAV